MKIRILIVAALAFSLALTGCYYDKAEMVYPQGCDTTNMRYSTDIVGILAANCYACHAGSASAGGGNMLEGYSNLINYVSNGKLVKAITHAPGVSAMPKNMPKMSECNINKIIAWVNSGAPNN